MIQALYNAASGLKNQQTNLNVVANNIANASTTGYKAETANFADALYQQLTDPSDAASSENLQEGTGTLVGSITKTFRAGTTKQTDRTLDVAITSDNGFFMVESASGDIEYTRNGNFNVSPVNGQNYLVTNTGEYVLDTNGNKIVLQGNLSSLKIDDNGTFYANGKTPFARLAVVDFQNPEGLTSLGNNNYAANASAGNLSMESESNLKQGALESSNVDMTTEMANMIKAQRAYQLSSKILSTADEMEGLANNLRR